MADRFRPAVTHFTRAHTHKGLPVLEQYDARRYLDGIGVAWRVGFGFSGASTIRNAFRPPAATRKTRATAAQAPSSLRRKLITLPEAKDILIAGSLSEHASERRGFINTQ